MLGVVILRRNLTIFIAVITCSNTALSDTATVSVLSHYYGREAGVELREDVETVLQPGMVVSMEPMIAIPEVNQVLGVIENTTFLLSETLERNISGFPYGPEHNVIEK